MRFVSCGFFFFRNPFFGIRYYFLILQSAEGSFLFSYSAMAVFCFSTFGPFFCADFPFFLLFFYRRIVRIVSLASSDLTRSVETPGFFLPPLFFLTLQS